MRRAPRRRSRCVRSLAGALGYADGRCPKPSWGFRVAVVGAFREAVGVFLGAKYFGIMIFRISSSGVSYLRSTDVNASKNRHNQVSQEFVRKFLNGKRRGDRVVVSRGPKVSGPSSIPSDEKKTLRDFIRTHVQLHRKKPSLTVTLSPLETWQKVFACYGYLVRTFCK